MPPIFTATRSVASPQGEFAAYSNRLGLDHPESSDFIDLGRASLDLLHQAMRCPECDWGMTAALGTPVDDFGGARRLAVLALLRSEHAFRRNDFQSWMADLAAVGTRGRRLGRGE